MKAIVTAELQAHLKGAAEPGASRVGVLLGQFDTASQTWYVLAYADSALPTSPVWSRRHVEALVTLAAELSPAATGGLAVVGAFAAGPAAFTAAATADAVADAFGPILAATTLEPPSQLLLLRAGTGDTASTLTAELSSTSSATACALSASFASLTGSIAVLSARVSLDDLFTAELPTLAPHAAAAGVDVAKLPLPAVTALIEAPLRAAALRLLARLEAGPFVAFPPPQPTTVAPPAAADATAATAAGGHTTATAAPVLLSLAVHGSKPLSSVLPSPASVAATVAAAGAAAAPEPQPVLMFVPDVNTDLLSSALAAPRPARAPPVTHVHLTGSIEARAAVPVALSVTAALALLRRDAATSLLARAHALAAEVASRHGGSLGPVGAADPITGARATGLTAVPVLGLRTALTPRAWVPLLPRAAWGTGPGTATASAGMSVNASIAVGAALAVCGSVGAAHVSVGGNADKAAAADASAPAPDTVACARALAGRLASAIDASTEAAADGDAAEKNADDKGKGGSKGVVPPAAGASAAAASAAASAAAGEAAPRISRAAARALAAGAATDTAMTPAGKPKMRQGPVGATNLMLIFSVFGALMSMFLLALPHLLGLKDKHAGVDAE
jgi:hypothetical protein